MAISAAVGATGDAAAQNVAPALRGGVFRIQHPLVAHHVTRMRRETTKSSEFRGLVRVQGQTLETGREIQIAPNGSTTEKLVVRTALPLSAAICWVWPTLRRR